MNYIYSVLVLIALSFSPTLIYSQNVATANVILNDVLVVGQDLTFDIYIHTDSLPLHLNTSDLPVEFDNNYFTNPTFTKVSNPMPVLGAIDNGYCTFVSKNNTVPPESSNNVQKFYFDRTFTQFFNGSSGALVAGINIPIIVINNQMEYDDKLAIIESDPCSGKNRLGRFKLTGYTGADDGTLAGLVLYDDLVGFTDTDNDSDFTLRQALDGIHTAGVSLPICATSPVNEVTYNTNSKVTLLPNPAFENFVISIDKFPSNWKGMTYQLVNLTGSAIRTGNMMGERTTVNIESLVTGLYFVHFLKDGKRTFDSQRLVVTRP